MNKGIGSIAVCGLAAYLVSTGSPGYAFLVVVFGLAYVWG